MHSEVLIQQFEYLVALAREKHFGRAAKVCNVSQPTLSVAIRRLERELGVVIVLRGHRFEGFTDEGSRVVTWAHRILAEVELGRSLLARCEANAADGDDVIELKNSIIRELARSGQDHPDFRAAWLS